ncbi:uncharacterized protein G2W53_000149 [Senna tora]|uniref:Uncharacterized protein n=1 Tax=Senna tora TaxID=362788 RepID=A0A834XF52_9FABA|nr:uncharacterized protein G2W53_000149 [Senna tora]
MRMPSPGDRSREKAEPKLTNELLQVKPWSRTR